MSHHLVKRSKVSPHALVRELPARQLERWCNQNRFKASLLTVLFATGVLLMGPLLDFFMGQAFAFTFVCIQMGAAVAALALYYKKIYHHKI